MTTQTYSYKDFEFPSSVVRKRYTIGAGGPISVNYFDGFGRLIQNREELDYPFSYIVKSYKYNKIGLIEFESIPHLSQPKSYTSPSDIGTTLNYDALNRVTTANNNLGTTKHSYQGWNETVTDMEGNKKEYHYDAFKRLVKVDEHNDGAIYETAYQYSPLGQITKITDDQGNLAEFDYDGMGRRSKRVDFHVAGDSSVGEYTYKYDLASNLINQVDPSGNKIVYSYDSLNRIKNEVLEGSIEHTSTFIYDSCENGKGQLCSLETPDLKKSYEYTAQGIVKKENMEIEGNVFSTSFEFDLQHNPLKITYPDGEELEYGYNTEAKLQFIKKGDKKIIENIEYSPILTFSKIEYGNGVVTENNYDQNELYRLKNKTTTHGQASLQDISYSYDKIGNIKEISDVAPTKVQHSSTFAYDDLSRLTSATIELQNGEIHERDYNYNSIGNITHKSDQGNYFYDGNIGNSFASPHAVTSIGITQINYDKRGNILNDGQRSFTWDHKNRLIKLQGGEEMEEYLYDHQGNRVKKTTASKSVLYINKFYEVEGDSTTKHIFAGDNLVASIEDGLKYISPDPNPDPDPDQTQTQTQTQIRTQTQTQIQTH